MRDIFAVILENSLLVFSHFYGFACPFRFYEKISQMDNLYASALLECSVKRSVISACPVAFGEIGVKNRVKNSLSYKKPLIWIIIFSVIICVLFAVFFLTSSNDEESSGEMSEMQSDVSANEESKESVETEESREEVVFGRVKKGDEIEFG